MGSAAVNLYTIPPGQPFLDALARWWLGLFPDLPPRLANECIWLAAENKLVNPWPG